jgi:hypothetical protein
MLLNRRGTSRKYFAPLRRGEGSEFIASQCLSSIRGPRILNLVVLGDLKCTGKAVLLDDQ